MIAQMKTTALEQLVDETNQTYSQLIEAQQVAEVASKSALEHAYTMGDRLLQIKKICPHGSYEKLLSSIKNPSTGEALNSRTARIYCNIFKNWEHIKDCPSLRSAQEELRQIRSAQNGNTVSEMSELDPLNEAEMFDPSNPANVRDVAIPGWQYILEQYGKIGTVEEWGNGYLVRNEKLGTPFPLTLDTRGKAWKWWLQRGDRYLAMLNESNERSDDLSLNSLVTDDYRLQETYPETGKSAGIEIPQASAVHHDNPSNRNSVLRSASTHEHYTPEHLWRPGLEMWGTEQFDLDPTTHPDSQIPTRHFFTKENDASDRPWIMPDNSPVQYLWSNFPWSDRDENGKLIPGVMLGWCMKLVHEMHEGNVVEALTLTKGDCRTEWWQMLATEAIAWLNIRGAVAYETASGNQEGSYFGSTLFYLSADKSVRFYKAKQFWQAYNPLGVISQQLQIK